MRDGRHRLRAGFEIGIELTAKARRLRLPVAEIPTIWLDRQAGDVELQGRASGSPCTFAGTCSHSDPRLTSGAGQVYGAEEGRKRPSMKVLVSGSAGFIGGYLVEELLGRGYSVVGIDNFSKYGHGRQVLRRPPELPLRRGRLPRHRADDQPAHRLRPLHRRRRADRRDLLLPHLRLRPARHQRADHRLVVRRRDQGAQGTAGCRRSRTCPPRWSSSRRPWPSYEGQERECRPRCPRTASRSSRSSTSRGPPGTSTSCRTRSSGRSTASASARRARSATSRYCRGNVKLAMSHVVPDLVQKVLKGQDPLHILGTASRSGTTPTAATWPAASSPRWSTPRRSTTTSTSRPPVHDGA